MIELKEIHFAYGACEVIRGLSMSVGSGEIVGILGPNGAGKSTLIRLAAGLIEAQRGTVTLEGRWVGALSARELASQVAVVPQQNVVPFAFTAFEVVLMGRSPHLSFFGFESARDIEIAREAMEATDCIEFASRDINELSGGERQRVFLARAIAQGPRLLLLDEPATFLDIRHQIALHKLLAKLNREKGLTIVSAMHDLNMASLFCDRIIMLKKGRILCDGAPGKIMSPENISAVFDAEILVGRDDLTGRPFCRPRV